MLRKIQVTVLLLAVLISVAGCGSGSAGNPTTTKTALHWSSPPAMQIDTSKTYIAVFNTSLGAFDVQLFAAQSPITVNNFVFLADQGYYNNTIFHRIIQAFMIQGGDPTGTGTGGPGYTFADELPPKQPYQPGIVAMANSGPNSNGSQFFICTGAESETLPPDYTQFGEVVSGMDVVLKIAAVPVEASSTGEISKPVNPPVINSIVIQVS